jgi:translation initiation factor IF-1
VARNILQTATNKEIYFKVAKDDIITMNGTIEEVQRNAIFKVKLENNHMITAVISGRMRQHKIQILLGDRVKIEMSPYDLTKGRVVYRER